MLYRQGLSLRAVARALGRAPSTVCRELRRNATRYDGSYRYQLANPHYANGRRSRSRRNTRFTAADWTAVAAGLREDWSPEQIVGQFRRCRILSISHETIYRYVWQDKQRGGTLWHHLRKAYKPFRKRYGRYDSRGRLAGKRHLSERPAGATSRSRFGHWEGDTVLGST